MSLFEIPSYLKDSIEECDLSDGSQEALKYALTMLFEHQILPNTEIKTLSLLPLYIKLAEEIILNRLYPYATSEDIDDKKIDGVGSKYTYLQAEIAIVLFNKRGAEGEIVRNENGINRTFAAASVPQELLNRIIPHGSIVK